MMLKRFVTFVTFGELENDEQAARTSRVCLVDKMIAQRRLCSR